MSGVGTQGGEPPEKPTPTIDLEMHADCFESP